MHLRDDGLSLQHGKSYTVLPQRLINGNWGTGMTDGVGPGLHAY